MKELGLERMEQISGGIKLPDAGCVVRTGLGGAAGAGSTAWILGTFWPAATMAGLLGGFVIGAFTCNWY